MPILTSMRNARDRFLQGTYEHCSWHLPAQLGPIRRFLLKLLFSHVSIEEDQLELIRNLPENAAIVYVTKHKSRLERLFFHFFMPRHGLPCPEIGLYYRSYMWQPFRQLMRIAGARLAHSRRYFKRPNPFASGYIARQMAAGQPIMLSLVESNEFYRRYIRSQTDSLAISGGIGEDFGASHLAGPAADVLPHPAGFSPFGTSGGIGPHGRVWPASCGNWSSIPRKCWWKSPNPSICNAF